MNPRRKTPAGAGVVRIELRLLSVNMFDGSSVLLRGKMNPSEDEVCGRSRLECRETEVANRTSRRDTRRASLKSWKGQVGHVPSSALPSFQDRKRQRKSFSTTLFQSCPWKMEEKVRKGKDIPHHLTAFLISAKTHPRGPYFLLFFWTF